MEKIDISALPDEVFNKFFEEHIKMYLEKNGNTASRVNEYVRFYFKEQCLLGKFVLTTRADKCKEGSFILSTFECKLCTDNKDDSNEYRSIPKLNRAWQETLVKHIDGYQELLNKYLTTDDEIKF